MNSAVLVALNGFRNSNLKRINSPARLSVMDMLPSPIFLLPAQRMTAPTPSDGPSKTLFAFGSSLAHGDQASHLCRSLTCGKTFVGGAFSIAERVTLN